MTSALSTPLGVPLVLQLQLIWVVSNMCAIVRRNDADSTRKPPLGVNRAQQEAVVGSVLHFCDK